MSRLIRYGIPIITFILCFWLGYATAQDARFNDLTQAGEIRFGLFATQYRANGEPQGARPDIARAFVESISGKIEFVLRPEPLHIIACLQKKECDVVILHRDERAEKFADFSEAILQYEFNMLVVKESALQNVSEVDRPDSRIAAVKGHAAANVAVARMKQAKVALVESEAAALALLRDGKADAIAQTRHSLLRMSTKVPGSRVLAGNYGTNINRFAILKGQPARLDVINKFVVRAKETGLLQAIVERNKESAFEVAPPGDQP